jgi:hypothetical protein
MLDALAEIVAARLLREAGVLPDGSDKPACSGRRLAPVRAADLSPREL